VKTGDLNAVFFHYDEDEVQSGTVVADRDGQIMVLNS